MSMGIIIEVKQKNGSVYLYAHGTCYMAQAVKSALERGKDRWKDSTYLTRIIFCEMLKTDLRHSGYIGGEVTGDDVLNDTIGFGIIATFEGTPDIVVDVLAQTVLFRDTIMLSFDQVLKSTMKQLK